MALKAVQPQPRIVWRVGMHSPGLHTYPLWARWLIRFVYFVTGYQATAHDIGVAEDEQQARSWLKGKNYFAKPQYLGVELPEESAGPGTVIWGDEEAALLYRKHSPDLVTMTRQDFETLQRAIEGTCRSAHRVSAR
jgi:hypothetical protein